MQRLMKNSDLRTINEEKEGLLVHYWQLPDNLFVSLKEDFHIYFCDLIKVKTGYNYKNCFYKTLNCPKWHAQRLFTRYTRLTLKELEVLRAFVGISREEIEQNIESIGNFEDGTIIRNPKLPFHMKDIFYVASHLMFDGCFRDKRGCYFYSYSDDLLEYHKNRLKSFGDVPMNFLVKDNQLFFSYTIGYIASKVLEISNFRSLEVYLSDKFKRLAKENKFLLDEFVKAMVVDEGAVDDKIRIELGNNEKFVNDIYQIISVYYELNKISSRERYVYFKKNPKWNHNLKSWKIEFSAISFTLLYESINPLPISYKQKNFELLYLRQNRSWYQRKYGETKKLIIKSLLEKPKSVLELSYELCVKNGTIISHLKGHPTYGESLINLGLVKKVEERILVKGGYAKADIFGIVDEEKAKKYIE